MTITDTLVQFAHDPTDPTPLAQGIVALACVDWAACGHAGFDEGTFNRFVTGQAAYGASPTFGGDNLTASSAALVNGVLSHALDYDDTHFAHIGHPSVVVFPAVVAAKPLNWTEFQEAALVGIEASIRVGLYLGPDHYMRGFHQTATAGAFGACLGAARAMNLNPDQTRQALGLCATMASGLKAQFGTMGKPLNAGLAARAGYEAAQWAWGNMSGAPDGLEAFAQAHDAAIDPRAIRDIGKIWYVETLSHKFHACCHGLHATLEALRDIDDPDSITELRISTHPCWMDVCNQSDPDTGLGAKFSYRHVAAMALAGVDTARIDHFQDEIATRSDLVKLRQKVSVRADTTLTDMQARVDVCRVTGEVETLFHDLGAPLSLDLRHARLVSKTNALLGKSRAQGLWDAAARGDIGGLFDVG